MLLVNTPASAGDAGDLGLIPWSGGSPGGGHGNPLQIPAWRIPWAEEPGRLQSMGLQSQTWLNEWTCTRSSILCVFVSPSKAPAWNRGSEGADEWIGQWVWPDASHSPAVHGLSLSGRLPFLLLFSWLLLRTFELEGSSSPPTWCGNGREHSSAGNYSSQDQW